MIITKSVSRFARNIVDCIETVRKLKHMGVGVFFEKENLNTLSAQSELSLTVLSSVAQEESMIKSKNIKWRYKRDFKQGVYNQGTMPYGYRMEEGARAGDTTGTDNTTDGSFFPHPEHVGVVKRIYRDYLNDHSALQIARTLTAEGTPTPLRAKHWSVHVTLAILKNERYIGDMRLQKYYAADNDETFKSRINYVDKTQYYISDTHTPIISRDDFDKVQALLAANPANNQHSRKQQSYPLSSKIICAGCGSTYVRKISHGKSGDTISWICHNDSANVPTCYNQPVTEADIWTGYNRMIQKLQNNDCRLLRCMQFDLQRLQHLQHIRRADDSRQAIDAINQHILALTKQSQILTRLRSDGILDSAIFMDKNDELNRQIARLKNERALAQRTFALSERVARLQAVWGFAPVLRNIPSAHHPLKRVAAQLT